MDGIDKIKQMAFGGSDVAGEPSAQTEGASQHEPKREAAPEGEPKPTPDAEEARIPRSRLNQESAKRRAAQEEAEALRKQLAELQDKLGEQQRERQFAELEAGKGLPEDFDEWSQHRQLLYLLKQAQGATPGGEAKSVGSKSPGAEVQAALERIDRFELAQGLSRTLGQDATPAQLDVVSEVKKNTGLEDIEELAYLASRREPDLFPNVADTGSAAHFVQGAGSGRQPSHPKQETAEDIMQRIVDAPDIGAMRQEQVRLIGSMMRGQG